MTNFDIGTFITVVIIIACVLGVLGAYLALTLSLSVRRIHDLGYSGWLVILLFIPLINTITLLVLAVVPGQPTSNEYGAPPTGGDFWRMLLGKTTTPPPRATEVPAPPTFSSES